jgi:hypothetical protein
MEDRELPLLCFDALLPFGRRVQFVRCPEPRGPLQPLVSSGFARPLERSGAQSTETGYELDALKQAMIDGSYKGPSTLLIHHEDFWARKKSLASEGKFYVASSRIDLRRLHLP